MISRVVCARRVCLSCQFGIIQPAVALPRPRPIQRSLGRRSFASADGLSKDDILEALMSGRRTVGVNPGKKESLPSWGAGKPKAPKPTQARPRSPKAVTAKSKQDKMRPIWEDMEVETKTEFKAKEGLAEGQREKQVTANPSRDRLDQPLRETDPYEKVEAAPASQDVFEQPTEEDIGESLETNETVDPNEAEDQQERPERIIGRSISDEDFSSWAADEQVTSQDSKGNGTRKRYMVGRTSLNRQSVGLGALGQKFDAIVMNDPDALGHKKTRHAQPQNQLPPSIALDTGTMFSTDDPGMAPDEEAFLNLDSLRPTMSSTLTRHEFESLRNLMAEGFNGSQLLLYWQRHRDPEAKPADPSAAYAWLKDLGTWKPVDDQMFSESGEKKAKHAYAHRILTQIWGLQVQEEVEVPGRVVARLRADSHTLISNPNIGFLNTITAEILDETIGEKITVEKSHKRLFITARKPVVPVILARINTILESLDRQQINLDGVPRDLVKREYINELEKVTKSIIIADNPGDSSAIDVYWPRVEVGDEASESIPKPETPADTIRRLLLGRHVPVRTAEEQIVAKRFRGEGVAAKAGTLTPYHRETRSMSWKDRLAPWARFITPAPAELKKVRWLKLPDKVSLPHMDEPSEPGPGNDLLTATFGHIIHAPLPKPKTRGRSKATYRRTISPVMPHPAAFTDLLPKADHHVVRKRFIIVHFVPMPGGVAGGAIAPALKLTMPFSGYEDFSTFTMPKKSTLHAPKLSFVKDILFPEEVVDARVERHCDAKLDIREQDALQDFMNASEFNYAGVLQTPKETRFAIPRTWLSKRGKKSDKGESSIDVPYLFGGLEVRQTLDLPWQENIDVRYESVEAGQHGGTRQELSLIMDLAKLETSKVESSVRDFLWQLGDAVEGKFWSWSQGVAKLKDLPANSDEILEKMRQKSAPKPSKTIEVESIETELVEQENLLEDDIFEVEADEPGAPVEGFEVAGVLDEFTAARRSEVIDWTSAPLAPSSEHLPNLDSEGAVEDRSVTDAVAELEQILMDETGSISGPKLSATDDGPIEAERSTDPASTEPNPRSGAPSTTQISPGPFSPTSSKQKDQLKHKLRQHAPKEDYKNVNEVNSDVEEYENMDPEALAAKMEAEAGAPSLTELYRRAGATPEQIAALEEESKNFEKEWEKMHEQLPSEEEQPRSREQIEAEDKMLKQFLAEDIARIEKEDMLAEEELDEGDNIEIDPAEEKRRRRLRKRRG